MKKILLSAGVVTILLVLGMFALAGPKKATNKLTDGFSNKSTGSLDTKSSNTKDLSAAKENTAKEPLLEPVTSQQFGDFQVINSNPSTLVVQNSTGPAQVSSGVETSKYQGVLYKTSATEFRVLYGRLSDKSVGIVQLADAFELIKNATVNGRTDVSLKIVTPSTIDLETTKIVRWTNLPETNEVPKAIFEYKKANQR